MCIVFPESIWGGICEILTTLVVKLSMFSSSSLDRYAFPSYKDVSILVSHALGRI